MLMDLKLRPVYDGMVYLSESGLNPPLMASHRHVELELNLVMRGEITYLVSGHRHTFGRGTLLWLLPIQEHQLIARSVDAAHYVAVFKEPLLAETGCREEYDRLQAQREAPVHSRVLDPATSAHLAGVMQECLIGAPPSGVLNRELGFGSNSDFHYDHVDPKALNAGLRYLLSSAWRHSRSGERSSAAVALHQAVRKAMQLIADEPEVQGLSHVRAPLRG